MEKPSDEWSAQAGAYVAAFVPPFLPLYTHIAKIVSTRAQMHDNFLLLDVGTGPGEPALTVAENILSKTQKARILGTDFSAGMIAAAASRLAASTVAHKDHVLFRVANDISEMPDDASFASRGTIDVITSTLVLQYVRDQSRFLEGVRSFLKPDGIFIVAVWKGYKEVPFLRAIKKTVISFAPPGPRKLETDEQWDADHSFCLGDSKKFAELITRANFVSAVHSEFVVPMDFTSVAHLFSFIQSAPFLQSRVAEAKQFLWTFLCDLKRETDSLPDPARRIVLGDTPDQPLRLPSVASIIVAKK